MEIVVHGTKGGRQIFTPKKLGGLLDVNSDTSKASAIGQEAYAVRFVEKTIIFSKYKIIRDVRGDKRTGFLAFSLFLPNNKKLRGTDILSVLDKVSDEYCKRYIPENDNNLKDVREDWAFLNRISEEYRTMLRSVSTEDIENLLSGTKDDAFIYYENDELQNYFDAPYQDEYRQYRQVLFVKKILKDKPEDPLNALRHSEILKDNLTGKIDLDKKEYALRDYDGQAKNGISIEIRVKGKLLYKKDKINTKDLISIRYSRKYFKEFVVKEGMLNDEWIRRYLFVDEENKKIDVEKNINLDPVTKTITFTIKDWDKKPINVQEIICKNSSGVIPIENYNQANFKGDDLGKRWSVSVNNDRFFSEERPIDFDKDCPGDTGSMDIILNKHRLEITALDDLNGDRLDSVNVIINKTEFSGSEINDKHKINVSCKGFDPYSFEYCPADDKLPIRIQLKRRQQGHVTESEYKYIASVGKHGTWKDGSSNDRFTKSSSSYSLKDLIAPDKGYKFTHFEKQGDRLVAKYENDDDFYQSPKFIASIIVGMIAIGFGIWALYSYFWKEEPVKPQQADVKYIKAYIEGNSLILDTLNFYKNNLVSYKNNLDTAQTKVLKSLDSAIKKREFIDACNFETLLKLDYSSAQQKFRIAIGKIESSRYDSIKKNLGNVDSLSLDQIADKIKSVLNTIISAAENEPEIDQKAKEKTGEEPQKESTESTKSKPNSGGISVTPVTKMDKTREIIQYLKGDELKKEELDKYFNDAGSNATLKKSIQLCLKFWDLDGSKNKSYSSFKQEIRNDANLKNSKLKGFVDNESSKQGAKYLHEITGNKTITTLMQLERKVQ